MNKIVLVLVLMLGLSCGKAHALAVIDPSNLAQNTIAAKEMLTQTMRQLEQLKTQYEQYQRQLKDAMNPGSFAWGEIQKTLDQLKSSMSSLKNLGGQGGDLQGFLGSFGTYETYGDGRMHESDAILQSSQYGMVMQKDSSDDLLTLIDKQQEDLEQYAREVDKLKEKSASAEGQQEAIQAGNQFTSMQIELLTKIHALLMAQNTLIGAQSEKKLDEEARQKVGEAIITGRSPMTDAHLSSESESFWVF